MQVDSNSTSRKRPQAHVVAKGAGGLSWVSMVAGLPVAAWAMPDADGERGRHLDQRRIPAAGRDVRARILFPINQKEKDVSVWGRYEGA